jgi:hypothetical protein
VTNIEGNDDSTAVASNNNNHVAVTNDLIELLEGQCQMTRDTASKVIANIDRAVRTGDVLENNTHHHYADNNDNGFGNMSNNSGNNGAIGVGGGGRTRSKSLGSEPLTYDVNFLGNLLQDAMMMSSSTTITTLESADVMDLSVAAAGSTAAAAPDAISQSSSENNTASASVEDVAMGILNNQNNTKKSATVGRNKQRSVTFDETQSSSTSFSWYNMPSSSVVSPITDPAVIEEDDDGVQFDTLGGILDVLDLEEDVGRVQQQQQQLQSHQEQQGHVMMDGTSLNTNKSNEESEIENEARGITSTSAVVLETQGGISGGFPQCQMIIDTPGQKVQPPSSTSPSSLSAPPPSSSAFPTLGETMGNTTTKPPPSSQKQKGRNNKSKKNREANDLAAALFRPSRSRSNSLMDHPNQRPRALSLASSSMLRPSSADAAGVISAPSSGNGGIGMMGSLLSQSLENAAAAATSAATTVDSGSNAIAMTSLSTTSSSSSSPQNISNNNGTNSGNTAQSELNSTTQLLLTLNSHLGTEAATLASQLTDGDLNLAQYLIEAARFDSSSDSRNNANSHSTSNRRSRICRHELRGTCYRSDCPYSHDLGGVTCLFWLRGRCRGENCRFMHGFAETLLDGISEEYLNEKREQDAKKEREKEEESKKIRTGNLLQHNQWAATSVSSSGNNLSKSLPNSQGFMFLSEGGNDATMTTMWR